MGADMVSIAASLLCIGAAGCQLAIDLHALASQISTAEDRISSISNDVSLTSSVLHQLGEFMNQGPVDSATSIFSYRVLHTMRRLGCRCHTIFTEFERAARDASEQIRGRGSLLRKINLSRSDREKWPFLQPSIEALRRDLQEAKATLMLMLHLTTLALSKRMADELADDKAEMGVRCDSATQNPDTGSGAIGSSREAESVTPTTMTPITPTRVSPLMSPNLDVTLEVLKAQPQSDVASISSTSETQVTPCSGAGMKSSAADKPSMGSANTTSETRRICSRIAIRAYRKKMKAKCEDKAKQISSQGGSVKVDEADDGRNDLQGTKTVEGHASLVSIEGGKNVSKKAGPLTESKFKKVHKACKSEDEDESQQPMNLSDESYEFVSRLDDSDESDESDKENADEAIDKREAERIVKDFVEKYTTLRVE
ncbi:MAG: hypothetical protein Q9221_001005 [Calogaya cf. arnoldii]